MNLTNLVKTKNLIDNVDHSKFESAYNNYVIEILKILNQCSAESSETIQKLQNTLNILFNETENIKTTLSDFKNKINNDLSERTKDWVQEGYVAENGNTMHSILVPELEKNNRSFFPSDQTKQKVLAVIYKKTNPVYACLEIGPGDSIWTQFLVAGDPLYIVDVHQEFIDSTRSVFPAPFQKRMRSYLLDFPNRYSLEKLPQGQIGFIFSWNVFDYFPKYETKLYLESCFKVLRPGGSMLFSYNNCNTEHGASLASIAAKSWMTEETMVSICQDIGYDIEINENGNDSWLVITKPGELKTVKTHQALGEIVNQNG